MESYGEPQPAALPAAVTKAATVEGITEYRLPNGLKVVIYPDQSKPTATVCVTYLVGSRSEGYGETGMAHLLEHLMFKGSTNVPAPVKEFNKRGFRMNGSTWIDRTNYHVSFPVGGDNLEFALHWAADSMVNSFIARKDLDTEMSVVRNEYEMGENRPFSVMLKRMQSVLFDWHNYGNSTIGARSDIENVRIANLQAFYHRYYRPDNAVLVVSGKVDPVNVLALAAKEFASVRAPKDPLPQEWTVEPTADGERVFEIRRSGESQLVAVGYRTPSALASDASALSVGVSAIADSPNGRLYKELVKTGLATRVTGFAIDGKDPSFVMFMATVPKGQDLGPVRERMIDVIENSFAKSSVTEEEIGRVKSEQDTAYRRTLADPEEFATSLSDYIGLGDWRLFFWSRDQIAAVTPKAVNAAFAKYFRRDNRVVGLFIPEDKPQRAEIAAAPKAADVLASYKARETGDEVEAFAATNENILARTQTVRIGGLKVALLPKKTRGHVVNVRIDPEFGSLATLRTTKAARTLLSEMFERGADGMTRGQIADAFTRLRINGSVTNFETDSEHVVEALALAARIVAKPDFPPAEFEQLKREMSVMIKSRSDQPVTKTRDAMNRHFNTYPKDDPRYAPTSAELLERIAATSLEDVRAYWKDVFGLSQGCVAVVGDFDVAAVKEAIEKIAQAHPASRPYERVTAEHRDVAPARFVIDTPDKENSVLSARTGFALRKDDPDAASMYVANWIFGGSSGLANRIIDRLRQKEGYSYSAHTGLRLGRIGNASVWSLMAIVAPQNLMKAEKAAREEIERAVREGFTEQEVKTAIKSLLDTRALARAQDSQVADTWASELGYDRDWSAVADFDKRISAVTADSVNAAFRRYIKPEAITWVLAGDSKKAGGLK